MCLHNVTIAVQAYHTHTPEVKHTHARSLSRDSITTTWRQIKTQQPSSIRTHLPRRDSRINPLLELICGESRRMEPPGGLGSRLQTITQPELQDIQGVSGSDRVTTSPLGEIKTSKTSSILSCFTSATLFPETPPHLRNPGDDSAVCTHTQKQTHTHTQSSVSLNAAVHCCRKLGPSCRCH